MARDMPIDTVYSRYFHPRLPAGLNSVSINGDAIDGGGENWEIWPELTDTFDGKQPLLLDQADLDMFETECPDLVIPCENDTVTIPCDPATLPIRRRA